LGGEILRATLLLSGGWEMVVTVVCWGPASEPAFRAGRSVMKAMRGSMGYRLWALAVGLLAAASLASGSPAHGQSQVLEDGVPDIIIYTHVTCPHCANAKDWLEDLQRRDPGVTIWIRELTEDPAAAADLWAAGRLAGMPSPSVPAWVLGGEVFLVGFDAPATTGRQIERTLTGLGRMASVAPVASPEPTSTELVVLQAEGSADTVACSQEAETPCAAADGSGADPAPQPQLRLATSESTTLSLPFFGELDGASMSLPALTGLIAFVDGFNPCSLWVLTFLLGIVIYSGSRKKTLLIGFTFLLVTASAYGLFIVGMFGTLRYLAYLSWITFAVAGMALIFALVNIKDYFWFKQGVSFTISDKHKPKFFQRTRNLMHPGRSVPALLVGTVVLALGITLVELPCTAGFPMVWTGIIASQGITPAYFAALLTFYLLVYLSIELVIFGSVVVSMKRSRFEEKHGRILKLMGGMIMLALAVTLVVAPDTMHSLGGTLLVFGGAIGTAVLTLVLHRRVLPRYGIVVGSEELEVEVASVAAVVGSEDAGT
jgi:cytochrome c biogenesis protein CcdA/glutaredoxin